MASSTKQGNINLTTSSPLATRQRMASSQSVSQVMNETNAEEREAFKKERAAKYLLKFS